MGEIVPISEIVRSQMLESDALEVAFERYASAKRRADVTGKLCDYREAVRLYDEFERLSRGQ